MKKILFISLALVLALGGLGVGYALWSDTVTVVTTVETGTVRVSLSQYDNDPGPHGVNDGDPATDDGWFTPSLDPSNFGSWGLVSGVPVWAGTRYVKNVGSTDSYLGNPDANGNIHTAHIVVDNAYPSYHGSVLFDVQNNGTIPVKLFKITLVSVSFDGLVAPLDYQINLDDQWWVNNLPPNGNWDWTFMVTSEPFGAPMTQIDPGETGYFDIDLHVLQDAIPSSHYDFVITLQFANWNE